MAGRARGARRAPSGVATAVRGRGWVRTAPATEGKGERRELTGGKVGSGQRGGEEVVGDDVRRGSRLAGEGLR